MSREVTSLVGPDQQWFNCYHLIVLPIDATETSSNDGRQMSFTPTSKNYYTPPNYTRQGILLAPATYFKTADISVVNSWIKDHGFNSPLQLTDDEDIEAARRVYITIEATTSFLKKKKKKKKKRKRKRRSLDKESSEEED
ncbi:hypothetical protein BGZ61DRAFT_548525 [Ilyonectria robusta]|uniref:uncharacterized protein n=1 Tax=Ilyonectria robusta TaxID=1079257 RepID=UPI001E8E47B3|nr:uncharacterized protein BGZ61DRAFT_548525 [Ilyonectria robusta]KAH8686616.1 hypothetical protein BGZ61DRAFT_548525 [Ilyonectria robusta]